MSICQNMIKSFMYGWERCGWGVLDLKIGIQYANDLISRGYKKEPFHHYDLKKFLFWCKLKLSGIERSK